MKYNKNKNVEFNISYRNKVKVIRETKALSFDGNTDTARPLPFLLQVGGSMGMAFFMLVGVILRVAMGSGLSSAIISSVMVFGSLFAMIFIPMWTRSYKKKEAERAERERHKKEMQRLRITDARLEGALNTERTYYKETYPDLSDCITQLAKNNKPGKDAKIDERLWQIKPGDDDFLIVKIGTGSAKPAFNAKIKSEDETDEEIFKDDPIYEQLTRLIGKYERVDGIPVLLNFNKDVFVGITGSLDAYEDFARCLVARLAFSHPYTELKLMFLSKDGNAGKADFARWLPHVWDSQRTQRYIFNFETMDDYVNKHLGSLIEKRIDDKEKGSSNKDIFLPHFIIFIKDDGESGWTETELWRKFFRPDVDLNGIGISFIVYGPSKRDLPRECTVVIRAERREDAAGVLRQKTIIMRDNGDNSNDVLNFLPDCPEDENGNDLNFDGAARTMFRARLKEPGLTGKIPDSISFLEMFNVRDVNELTLWQKHVEGGIVATLGIGAIGKEVSLDISEKADGPHGLIAGTTGSGKSELIAAFILSLAVNYSPQDVTFFLIDYKGGELSDRFKDLPHLAGAFTNLNVGDAERTLIAVTAEVTRRQKELARLSAKDIKDYRAKDIKVYKEKKEMPYLIIIVDEFAELKNTYGNFIDRLVSIARVGRSLGIHLVLATQRPSGNITQEIQSNTSFRICLRVANKEDSKDIIGDNSAMELTQSGRAYIKTSDGNPKLVQTAYAAANYTTDPQEMARNKAFFGVIENSKVNTTNLTKLLPNDGKEKIPQSVKVIEKIKSFANGNCAKKLMLDSLAKIIPLGETTTKGLAFTIGPYDNVEELTQPPLTVDFEKTGNVCLYGTIRTGKTTFLHSLICQIAQNYTADNLHLYVLDGNGQLGFNDFKSKDFPHIGEIVSTNSENYVEKSKNLIFKLSRELAKRIEAFNILNAKDFSDYNYKAEKKLPYILTIVDPISLFYNDNWDAGDVNSKFLRLVRIGRDYGMFFFITAVNSIDVKQSFGIHFPRKLTFELASPDYTNVLGARVAGRFNQTVQQTPGRGLSVVNKKIYEFQTAVFAGENVKKIQENEIVFDDDAYFGQLRAAVKKIADENLNIDKELLPKPIDPKALTLDEAFASEKIKKKMAEGNLLIGFDVIFGDPIYISARGGGFCVVCEDVAVLTAIINCFYFMYKSFVKYTDEQILLFDNEYDWTRESEDAEETVGSLKYLINKVYSPRSAGVDTSSKPYIVFIDDLQYFHRKLPDRFTAKKSKNEKGEEISINVFQQVVAQASKFNIKFIVTGKPSDSGVWGDNTYEDLMKQKHGLVVTNKFTDFNGFGTTNVGVSDQTKEIKKSEMHYLNGNFYQRLLMFEDHKEMRE